MSKTKIEVTWCKWSFFSNFYKLHTKIFYNINKAKRFVEKLPKSAFIWQYKMNGVEVDEL